MYVHPSGCQRPADILLSKQILSLPLLAYTVVELRLRNQGRTSGNKRQVQGTFDLCAVFWDGPIANLYDLFRVCADTFFCDHMSQV